MKIETIDDTENPLEDKYTVTVSPLELLCLGVALEECVSIAAEDPEAKVAWLWQIMAAMLLKIDTADALQIVTKATQALTQVET